ncbi:MAG: TlyA family RNA methyltransferase [Oscillospiraceae bacterium]|nr:TlyA family RNA methyltransferase [Oscillospiraceae bacterium]
MNRLDKELHLRGLVKSRTAAAELIENGAVSVNGTICRKPSHSVEPYDIISIVGEQPRYVSRGGLKLEHALNEFAINLTGLVCLDVGASTGGFTDCMLQHGAKRVYAVDVGTNQFDADLRNDDRVILMEQYDIRNAKLFEKSEKIDFTAVDVSFISLKHILPTFVGANCVRPQNIIVLIKPQFELGKKHKGVITDKKIQQGVVDDIRMFAQSLGFTVIGTTVSPIHGGSGNKEFLMYIRR